MEGELWNVIHEIPPIYDENSKILILGSFPSVKSESQFFYGHRKIVSGKSGTDFHQEVPVTIEEKGNYY